MPSFADIPKTVTLLNMTEQTQLLEYGYKIPGGTKVAGKFTPGELIVDLTTLSAFRRERFWAACNNAHAGEVLKIKK